MGKIINLSDWEQKNFVKSSDKNQPGLTVIFPSREIYFSAELLNLMRLKIETCPKTLDQWYELCHPEDHAKISGLESKIYDYKARENFFTLTRKLYCGDGFYRNFRLEAFILRDSEGRPQKLTGNEILPLRAWLDSASEGDFIECENENGMIKIFEAVRVQGVMTLRDLTMIEDLKNENLILRREIQRRIFSPVGENPILNFQPDDSEILLKNTFEENINAALNMVAGKSQLKSLKRSLENNDLVVGVGGLGSSGKSTLINSLLGEKLIPGSTQIPVFCSEGENREAKIFYRDGRNEIISGSKFTSSSITKNIDKGILRIEITIPGAVIPRRIRLVEMPENLTALKNILPEIDIAVYVTPLRMRLKSSDYEYLKLVNSISGKIILVLSQIDLERSESEAGNLIFSVKDKILNNIQAIQNDMKKFFGGDSRDYDVIPLTAKKALENFYDKNSQDYKNSNVEKFVEYIGQFKTDSLKFRAERALKILENENPRRSSASKLSVIKENLKKFSSAERTHAEFSAEIFTGEYESTKSEGLLSSLIISMREHDFKRRFFSLDSFRGERKAVFLGADRTQSIKLFSRLAHNVTLERFDFDDSKLLCSGNDIPFEGESLPVIGADENILIAPSDSEIADQKSEWRKIFADYTPVISVDVLRIESGFSDLLNSPYFEELKKFKWVLAFGNCGMFDGRDDELRTEIPKKISEFSESNGIMSPDCFMFENYRIF